MEGNPVLHCRTVDRYSITKYICYVTNTVCYITGVTGLCGSNAIMEKYDLGFIYALLGETVSRVLLYIARFGDSYPTEIANNFSMNQRRVQYRMEKLEDKGILISRLVGRTRLYRINPRYVLKDELMDLLQKALEYLPEEEIETNYKKRRRPRTKGKALKRYRENAE